MHESQSGKEILKGLMIDRFDAPQEEWYQDVKRMKSVLNNPRLN